MAQTRAIFISTLLHLSIPSIFIFLLFPLQIHAAQPPNAPSPSPSSTPEPDPSSTPGPLDIIDILKKGRQFSIFSKFLDTTNHLGKQINTQLITSNEGITVLAPTDGAFASLPSGTLNKLANEQRVQLIQFHILPTFYSLDDLETASNPVRTLAGGPGGKVFVLNFTGHDNVINITSGVVQTQVSNTLRQEFPLAVYQVDKVLLPLEFTKPSPSPGSKGRPTKTDAAAAAAPEQPNESSPADEPSATANDDEPNNSAGRIRQLVGFGLAPAIVLFCMGVF